MSLNTRPDNHKNKNKPNRSFPQWRKIVPKGVLDDDSRVE
jgi:hypothetical protein